MDFRDMSEMPSETIETPAASAAAAPPAAPARQDSHAVRPRPFPVEVDHSRDALLTEFGKETLKDRYLLPGEGIQDLFVRVASA
jgi:ribonucleoside-diphosphate reductase alpha chain